MKFIYCKSLGGGLNDFDNALDLQHSFHALIGFPKVIFSRASLAEPAAAPREGTLSLQGLRL